MTQPAASRADRGPFLDRALGCEEARFLDMLLGGHGQAQKAMRNGCLPIRSAADCLDLPNERVTAVADSCRAMMATVFGLKTSWTWSPSTEMRFDGDLAEAIPAAPLLRRVAGADRPSLPYDAETERWIRDLVAAATAGIAVHVLYRIRLEAAGAWESGRDIEDLAQRIDHVAGADGPDVLVIPRGVLGLSLGGSPAYAAIASGLAPARAIKIFGYALVEASPGAPSDDEFEQLPCDPSATLVKLAQLMGQMDGVHIWCVPQDARLAACLIPHVGGAFGPATFDPVDARARLRAMAPGPVSSAALEAIGRVYDDPRGATAVMAFAAASYALAQPDQPEPDLSAIAQRLCASMMPHLKRHAPLPASSACFDLDLVNTDLDLKLLCDRAAPLRAAGVRCLAHGIEGSGKTEFAWWLCRDILKMPLKEARPSLIFEKAWGATERRIETFMASAAVEGAAVLFSDCESLFGVRRPEGGSNMALTIAATNAFLAALERFPAPVFASTNLLCEVDAAVRRRFDLCLEFRPLTPAQVPLAWRRLLGLEKPVRLDTGHDHVVADFVVTAKRLRLFGETGPEAAVKHLKAAAEARSQTAGQVRDRSRIGFVGPEPVR